MDVSLDSDAGLSEQVGEIYWSELERHFARGVIIWVAADLDLIEVAMAFAKDDAERLRYWLDQKDVIKAQDAHAQTWSEAKALLRAIVVAPWVLVQERRTH